METENKVHSKLYYELTDKDDKKAYARTKEVAAESEFSDKYYSYLPEFCELLANGKSYIRTRAFILCCSQSKWDIRGEIKKIFPHMLALLHDSKPAVVRQCLKAIAEVAVYRTELCGRIEEEISKIDLSEYKESMSELIRKDIDELRSILMSAGNNRINYYFNGSSVSPGNLSAGRRNAAVRLEDLSESANDLRVHSYDLHGSTYDNPIVDNLNVSHRVSPTAKAIDCSDLFSIEVAGKVLDFHRSIPGYAPTRLVSLEALAVKLGVESICVKDESSRFSLNAFKGLGGSYCIASYLAKQFNIPQNELCYNRLRNLKDKGLLKNMTVCTATDGNHGRGIAWAANRLGIRCHVYLPKGSSEERLNNILKENAEAEITSMNYDDTVRYASEMAEENGWILMQDTSTDNANGTNEADVPDEMLIRLMQGYTSMAAEISEQWRGNAPTHVFLQAGVGAMAGAMTACFADLFKKEKPVFIIVESNKADCIYRTAAADDGKLHYVGGDLSTIMVGLACGEPCAPAWEILKNKATCFLSVSDEIAVSGMRKLGKPEKGDPVIISGESGAVTLGAVAEIAGNDDYALLRKHLGLNSDSRVLVISTEGDTDRKNYEKIMKI